MRSAGTQRWLDELLSISIAELMERIQAFEDEFGVSPFPPRHNGNGNGNGVPAEDISAAERQA